MKIRVLSLLLVLFLVGCAELPDLPPGSYGLFPRDGQDVTPGGTLVFQGWNIEVVAGLPTGVAVTHTPYPTYTQPPTYTPYPTYTPVGQAATPTPDSGITPSPTSPAVKVCLATTSAPINLRNDHSTNATIIDNIDPNTRMEVQHIWIVTDVTNEWFQVRALARSGVVRVGWVFRGTSVFLGVDDTEELCWDVPTSGPGSQDNTPVPTPTPPTATMTPLPPPVNVCMYRNAQNTMTIRQSYSTTSARVSSLPANVPAVVGHLFPNTATEAWAFINYGGITGWVAIRSGGTPYGTLEGDCSNIRRDQPTTALEIGTHTLIGVQGEITGYAEAFQTMKCLTHTEQLCLFAKERNPNLTLVYRTLHVSDGMRDCPRPDEWHIPSIWYSKMKPHWPDGFDYYEIINECGPPSAAVMAQFSIEVAKLAAANGKAILAFSYYPGAPEISEWDALYTYLAWADANPLPDGRYHGLALHASGYAPPNQVPQGSWINDIWVAGRHTLVDARLNLVHNYSLKQFKGPIYITEYGYDDGYQSLSLPPLGWTCEQYGRAITETRRVLEAQGIVDGVHIWNFGNGGGGQWTDLYPCINEIAGAA